MKMLCPATADMVAFPMFENRSVYAWGFRRIYRAESVRGIGGMVSPNVNRAKQKLLLGGYAFGTWIGQGRNPAIVRVAAEVGFDFVYLDMEHSSLSWETVGDFCEMARAYSISPIVRTSDLTRPTTLRLQEIGAQGVMFHDVDSRAEVEEILDWMLNSKAMLELDNTHKSSGSQMAVVIQIETAKGLEAVDKILAGGGIDIVEIGRGDLAAELGYPGQRDHPEVLAAIDRIIAACHRHGVAPGVTCLTSADVDSMVKRGLRWLTYSSDAAILASGYREGLAKLRNLTSSFSTTKMSGR